jgi:3-oxoacyl-[acyl-carrier protein] reductase
MSHRVVLITGSNGGLGQSIARAFLDESESNRVWLGVRARRAAADALSAAHPDRCRVLELEVTDRAAWSSGVAEIIRRDQRLDVLVNNAGGHEDALLGTMEPASWDRVLAGNLDAVFHGCQAVLPTMISQKHGRIITIASLSALLPPAGQTNYAAAKAGAIALSQSLSKEVARLGITVNVVSPGYVETDALARLGEDERRALQSRIPMRRFGKPSEVAAAVRFLACSDAAYITGSNLKIDGGIL